MSPPHPGAGPLSLSHLCSIGLIPASENNLSIKTTTNVYKPSYNNTNSTKLSLSNLKLKTKTSSQSGSNSIKVNTNRNAKHAIAFQKFLNGSSASCKTKLLTTKYRPTYYEWEASKIGSSSSNLSSMSAFQLERLKEESWIIYRGWCKHNGLDSSNIGADKTKYREMLKDRDSWSGSNSNYEDFDSEGISWSKYYWTTYADTYVHELKDYREGFWQNWRSNVLLEMVKECKREQVKSG